MNDVKGKKFKITREGRLKDAEIRVEDYIENMCRDGHMSSSCLVELAMTGNFAALNAITEEKYTISNEPFVYGKIGAFGFIVSEKDLEPIKEEIK